MHVPHRRTDPDAHPTRRRPARVVWAWLLLLAGTPLALAQGDPAPPPTAEDTPPAIQRPADPRARSARRLLLTAGGTWLRGPSRWTDDHWEIRPRRTWQPLPPGLVEEWKLEADVLDELRQRRRELRGAGPTARAGLASWMVRAGLWTEAFGEMDAVLEEEPDQPTVLALLRTLGPLVSLPEVGEAPDDPHGPLLKAAASAPPSLQEMAVHRLARSPDLERLQGELQEGLQRGPSRRRAFAALALRRLFPGSGLRPLLRRAVLDPAEDVRRTASLALRDAQAEAVILPVLRALGSDSPTVRTRAAEALGWAGYPAAVEPLIGHLAAVEKGRVGGGLPATGSIFVGTQHAFVQGFDVEVASGAVIANPRVGTIPEGATLDVRVHGTSRRPAEARAVRESLQRLTGARPGRSARDWQRWWEQHGGPPRQGGRYATTGEDDGSG